MSINKVTHITDFKPGDIVFVGDADNRYWHICKVLPKNPRHPRRHSVHDYMTGRDRRVSSQETVLALKPEITHCPPSELTRICGRIRALEIQRNKLLEDFSLGSFEERHAAVVQIGYKDRRKAAMDEIKEIGARYIPAPVEG